MRYPAVLEQWLPQWQEWAVATATLEVAGLGWLGTAGVVIVWVLWAVGAGLLLLLALLLSWAVRRLPRPVPVQAKAASS